VDSADIDDAQYSSPESARATQSSALKVIKVNMGDSSLLVDTSSGLLRPLVWE
jgi:hypothetical protein